MCAGCTTMFLLHLFQCLLTTQTWKITPLSCNTMYASVYTQLTFTYTPHFILHAICYGVLQRCLNNTWSKRRKVDPHRAQPADDERHSPVDNKCTVSREIIRCSLSHSFPDDTTRALTGLTHAPDKIRRRKTCFGFSYCSRCRRLYEQRNHNNVATVCANCVLKRSLASAATKRLMCAIANRPVQCLRWLWARVGVVCGCGKYAFSPMWRGAKLATATAQLASRRFPLRNVCLFC